MPAAASLYTGPAGSPYPGFTQDQSILYVTFKVTPSGAYAALGDILDFTALGDVIKSSYIPLWVEIQSINPAGGSGFVYSYRPGTTIANGKFQVLTSNGVAPNPLLDLGAGAYAAAILADVIVGVAAFVRA